MNTTSIRSLALTHLLAATLLAATLPGAAQAASSDEKRESAALDGAKVSLSQAIAIAEQRTGGHAFDAGVDVAHGQVEIAVETNGPTGVQTVVVDAGSGRVVAAHAGGEPD